MRSEDACDGVLGPGALPLLPGVESFFGFVGVSTGVEGVFLLSEPDPEGVDTFVPGGFELWLVLSRVLLDTVTIV